MFAGGPQVHLMSMHTTAFSKIQFVSLNLNKIDIFFVVIPLGMLEPPFYQYKRDEILNFGALGSLIGHELSHSLDSAGILADPSGKIRKWLPDHDLNLYKNRIQCYNNSHTIGENIADANGIRISLSAFKNRHPEREINQFFISFAQVTHY